MKTRKSNADSKQTRLASLPAVITSHESSSRPRPKMDVEYLHEFREAHPDWSSRRLGEFSTMAIRSKAILGHSLSKFYSVADLEAERAYTRLCQKLCAVGLRADQSIRFPYLTSKIASISDEDIAALNWPMDCHAALDEMSVIANSHSDRLLGVAGSLLTEPQFLMDQEALRKQWLFLPKAMRPPFPLQRPFRDSVGTFVSAGSKIVAGELANLLTQIVGFLDRWGLLALVDWDLPEPQGPLFPNYLHHDSSAKPPHGVHLVIPVHHQIKPEEVMRQIKALQADAAKDIGCPADLVGCPHYEQYAQFFRFLQLESAIRSRFEKIPRGLVTAIKLAAADELHLAYQSVHRLSHWISRCRQGKRQTLARLRTPR